MKRKTLVSWSSGKESAWVVHLLRRSADIDLAGLFCTVNSEFDRVAMHGVRVELLQRQAESLGLPLEIIELPHPCDDGNYGEIMERFVRAAKKAGVECFAFGDLFLEDVRDYRVEKLAGTGITPLFPLWGRATDELSREMVRSGLRTVITCVDPKQAPAAWAGKEYDDPFLDGLPSTVDPCGERGEFHSFVFDGPMYKEKIEINVGDIVRRDGFVFADIVPYRA